MAWKLEGHIYESCSCKMVCRCTLGPAEPDQGWCSAVLVVDLASGDGRRLDGARYAMAIQAPGDFLGGIEKARLYFDASTADGSQRSAIESIIQGRAGGFWEGVQGLISEWLPSREAEISISVDGDNVQVSVGGAGEVRLAAVRTAEGTQTKLVGAPVAAALHIDYYDLALANGTRWSDPDLRAWESLGFGAQESFSWAS
jgi:hypothetical protein